MIILKYYLIVVSQKIFLPDRGIFRKVNDILNVTFVTDMLDAKYMAVSLVLSLRESKYENRKSIIKFPKGFNSFMTCLAYDRSWLVPLQRTLHSLEVDCGRCGNAWKTTNYFEAFSMKNFR